MTTAYLSLGSNMGDRLKSLAEAVRRLDQAPMRAAGVSSVYETAPQGKTDQPAFLNIAAAVETSDSPQVLLAHIHRVEQSLGRVRLERWGPRTIDIDILLFGDMAVNEPQLEIPHPRMMDRAFVLVPLLELNPPGGEPLRRALEDLPDQGVQVCMDAASFLSLVRGVQ